MTTTATNIEQKELPVGWKWVKLGDVCEITMGQSPNGDSYNNLAKGVPLLNGPTEFGETSPTAVQWTTKPTRLCEKNDILLCVRGNTTGRMNRADQQYCIGRGLASIRQFEDVTDTPFLSFMLISVSGALLATTSGSTFPNLSGKNLSEFRVALPPLEEQKRIAGILNEQMAAVEEAKKAAQERLEAAQALPAAYLREVFPSSEDELPAGWKWVRLGDACKVISGRDVSPAQRNTDGNGTGYISGPADFGVDMAQISKWTTVPQSLCNPKDILITVKGAGVGKINIAPDQESCIGRDIMAVRTTTESHSYQYFYWCLATNFKLLQDMAQGATVPGLSRIHIEGIPIPLPPLGEQKRIASDLDDKLAGVKLAEASIQQELDTIEAMPAALLRKAFSGGLQ